jgi:hypothetical protein
MILGVFKKNGSITWMNFNLNSFVLHIIFCNIIQQDEYEKGSFISLKPKRKECAIVFQKPLKFKSYGKQG